MMNLDLLSCSVFPSDDLALNKTHLFINLSRAEYCFELSFAYQYEKLRRLQTEWYMKSNSELFEWCPDDTLGGALGCDLSGYVWQFGDPGVWLAGQHLSHYEAILSAESKMLHVPFRSTTEIQTLFYASIELAFCCNQRKYNYKRLQMLVNRMTRLRNQYILRQPLT